MSLLTDAERNSVIYVFGGSKTSAALSVRRACRQRASFTRQAFLFLGRSRHSRRMLPVSSFSPWPPLPGTPPPSPKHKHTQTERRHAHTLRMRAKSGLGYSPCVTLDNTFNISGPLCPNSVLAPAEWGAGKSQNCSWVLFFCFFGVTDSFYYNNDSINAYRPSAWTRPDDESRERAVTQAREHYVHTVTEGGIGSAARVRWASQGRRRVMKKCNPNTCQINMVGLNKQGFPLKYTSSRSV